MEVIANDKLKPSWNRSKTKYGLDASSIMENDVISNQELKERKERIHILFQTSTPILENLFSTIKDLPFIIAVSDRDGYIVSLWGEHLPFMSQTKHVRVDLGTNWNEKVKGTNAIGTALTEQKAVHIYGEEHFCDSVKFLTCYSAPLFSSTGELLGVLDVSGDISMHNPYLMQMIVSAAQACQSQLLLKSANQELTFLLHETDVLATHYQQPLVAVDENGLITRINERASRILEHPTKNSVGQHLCNWITQTEMESILNLNKSSTVPLALNSSSKNATKNAWFVTPVQDKRKKRFILTKNPPTKNHHEESKLPPKSFIYDCPKAYKILQFSRSVAKTDATIFLHGESGTGKENIAQEIHTYSKRTGDFIVINCGAIPKELMESELFGYEKGAFTGANKHGKTGKAQAAHNGTLFLDEIGEMPLASQIVLLRLLEEREIVPIGSNRTEKVNIRVVAATNKDLMKEVEQGNFREDLYYRLTEIEINMVPLCKRSDFSKLVTYFLHMFSEELQINNIHLTDAVFQKLASYHWPGNIRELKNVVRKTLYHAWFVQESDTITTQSLPELRYANDAEYPANTKHEKDLVSNAIIEANGNLSEAARHLNISRTTLYRKIRENDDLTKKLREIRNQL